MFEYCTGATAFIGAAACMSAWFTEPRELGRMPVIAAIPTRLTKVTEIAAPAISG
ncbi:MAG: hypothetical protein PVSMB11_11750 [Desulfuromonadaceae bacterium]